MIVKCNCPLLVFCFVLLAFMGCKKKDTGTGGGVHSAAVSADEIAKAVDVMTRGMREISPNKLSASYGGKPCVVTGRQPEGGLDLGSTPPPRGMLRFMGQTVIYCGEIEEVSAGSIAVRAPYPTPGNYKTVEIAREDIESVHVKL